MIGIETTFHTIYFFDPYRNSSIVEIFLLNFGRLHYIYSVSIVFGMKICRLQHFMAMFCLRDLVIV